MKYVDVHGFARAILLLRGAKKAFVICWYWDRLWP